MEKLESDKLLDELFALTNKEYNEELTAKENERYVEIVNILNFYGIEIPFGIEV